MKQGKLTSAQLKKHVLDQIVPGNAETVLGAGIGEDCCAVDTGDVCVISTDPITAADHQVGALAIHINANDIAAAGAQPIAALVTILIPSSSSIEQVDDVMQELTETAAELGIDITGGHTEVTDSVNRIVVSVTMIGKPVVRGKIVKTADMRVGDQLIMTKCAGIEGTLIIARDYETDLAGVLDDVDRALAFGLQAQLSVVREGTLAAGLEGVSAMHDITEGGVKGAICEMCEAAGVGAEINLDKIPVLDVTRKICEYYDIDIYSLISSGSMLIAAQNGEDVAEVLTSAGIQATIIGRVTEGGVRDASTGQEIIAQSADALYGVVGNN